jgi:hypothetical protein
MEHGCVPTVEHFFCPKGCGNGLFDKLSTGEKVLRWEAAIGKKLAIQRQIARRTCPSANRAIGAFKKAAD